MNEFFLDPKRTKRTGMPEVVFAQHKTAEQCATALTGLLKTNGHSFATKVSPEKGEYLSKTITGTFDEIAQTYQCGEPMPQKKQVIAVVCAGTSDLPIAREAENTLRFLGYQVSAINDVGVAGLHRTIARLDDIKAADYVIVIAGMEGALPSVLGGLIPNPMVAVPTSVGYGACFQGISALLGMLNSCAPGLSVVNIDNGFGAAVVAHRHLTFTQNTL